MMLMWQSNWKSMWQIFFFLLLVTLVFSINYLMIETTLTQYLKVQIDIPLCSLGVIVTLQV